MPSVNEKLAESLEVLADLQKPGRRVFPSSEISRTHRDRLRRAGFVAPVIKGWWMATDPGARPGDTTAWYSSFWQFCGEYCSSRFGEAWHLSPEISLLLNAEATDVPQQVVVHAQGGTNNKVELPFGTSLYDYSVDALPDESVIIERDGLRLLTPSGALVRVQPSFYVRRPIEAQMALASVWHASEVLAPLLREDRTVVAGRLVGAFRRIGREALADEIAETMSRAGHLIREVDPFETELRPIEVGTRTPAVVGRLRGLWTAMRGDVVERFPAPPIDRPSAEAYLRLVDAMYDRDAYHSLSIEGYRVTPELIERVRTGEWNPEDHLHDRSSRDALAARGYWLAFQRVRSAIEAVVEAPESAAAIVREAHSAWYRDLFQPSVQAGLIDSTQLAGVRTGPVFIRNSRHVPPRAEAVRDAMPALFELLEQEEHASVRAVLGHWMLGYIHPFPDGNGRIARFLMNTMLASGGFPWVVIRLEERSEYMSALESASVDRDIRPFADFVAGGVRRASEDAR